MEAKEIIEGNRLIAEFDGWEILPNQGTKKIEHFIKNGYRLSINDIYYHQYWDWIMPVVEKITSIDDGKFYIMISSVGIWCTTIGRDDISEQEVASMGGMTPIENTWYAVVNFIKWYNKSNNK